VLDNGNSVLVSSSAATETLKKWQVKGRNLGRGLPPHQFWGYNPWEMFENIGANLCNLVYFGDIKSSKSGAEKETIFRPTFKSGAEFTITAV